MINALSIDVEEFFQVHGFERVIRREDWDRYPSRVVEGTSRILRLLDEFGVQGTFFMLGWVAERHPDLVRAIAAAGHEIASHGFWHELVYRQTPRQFADDVRQSLDAIHRACGRECVQGYRAPSFSITRESLWAIDVLADLGLAYDSSIFPLSVHDRYGIPSAPRFVNRVHPKLCEVPVSTVRWIRRNWPVAGGGYFRLLPLWVTRRAIRRINGEGHPAVVYLHPWEFDPDQPRVRQAPWTSRFRHYVNLDKTERRLRSLLGQFRFGPIRDVYAQSLLLN